MALRWQKEKEVSFFSVVMSSVDVYPRLNSLEPGFLKRDVTRHAKANGMYTGELGNFSGKELLSLKMAQVHVLPLSLERIQKKSQHPLKKWGKEAQLVSNFATNIPPKITKLVHTLGNILNPHEVYETSIVAYLGEESIINDLKNMETTR